MRIRAQDHSGNTRMTTIASSLFSRWTNSSLGRRGNVAILTALMIIPMVGSVGLAVDGARAYMLHSKMMSALDAAALAGGRVLSTDNVEADAKMYFRTNIPADYLGAVVGTPKVTVGEDNETLTITASATLPTTFMRVLGINTVPVSVSNQVRRAMRGLELALVLDVTGSMWGSKLDKMKASAADLVDILFGSDKSSGNGNGILRISVVPYAATVNLGVDWKDDWLNTSPKLSDYPLHDSETWRGCVEARKDNDSNELPPGDVKFTRFMYPSTLNDHPTMADNDWDADKITDSIRNYANNNNRQGPNLGCPPPILPLSDNKKLIKDKIEELKGVNRGGTMANLGLQAGWFSLSPLWRHAWDIKHPTIPGDVPLNYNDPDSQKAVVLLTDGTNEWYDWPDRLPAGDFTAYGRPTEKRLGTSNLASATAEINKRMVNLCAAMREKNITIYTITLEVTNTTTKDLYRSCASQASYYFNSPSSSDLRGIFQEIGSQLSNLRIEK